MCTQSKTNSAILMPINTVPFFACEEGSGPCLSFRHGSKKLSPKDVSTFFLQIFNVLRNLVEFIKCLIPMNIPDNRSKSVLY